MSIGVSHFSRGLEIDEIENCFIFYNSNSAEINYATVFPSLTTLCIFPWSAKCSQGIKNIDWRQSKKCRDPIDKIWKDCESFFDTFFPNRETRQICKTLQRLDLPYESCWNEEMIENGNVIFCPRISDLAKIFPNVHNKWLNKARN